MALASVGKAASRCPLRRGYCVPPSFRHLSRDVVTEDEKGDESEPRIGIESQTKDNALPLARPKREGSAVALPYRLFKALAVVVFEPGPPENARPAEAPKEAPKDLGLSASLALLRRRLARLARRLSPSR